MDWSKAKTILIIVFLIANIFLGYQYTLQDIKANATLTEESIHKSVAELNKKNISIHGDIPTKAIDMPNIKVKYKSFEKQDVLKLFFDENDDISLKEETDSLKVEDDKTSIQVNYGKELSYLNKKGMPQKGIIDEAKSMKVLEDFLRKMNIFISSIDIEKKSSADGYLLIEGVQKYKDLFVNGTSISIKVNENGVFSAKILWFGDIQPDETSSKEVLTSIKALQKAAKYYSENFDGINIFEIKQGYYFGFKESGVPSIKLIEEGTAIPVWRISGDKETLYINAYNGQIEK